MQRPRSASGQALPGAHQGAPKGTGLRVGRPVGRSRLRLREVCLLFDSTNHTCPCCARRLLNRSPRPDDVTIQLFDWATTPGSPRAPPSKSYSPSAPDHRNRSPHRRDAAALLCR